MKFLQVSYVKCSTGKGRCYRRVKLFSRIVSLVYIYMYIYGAEIAELTGIYLLKQVNDSLSRLGEKTHAGLYRDDGLIYIENANGPLINKIEKALHRIFKNNKLNISMEQKGHTVNFLDVTLTTDGSHHQGTQR